ncbi:related to beta-N-acetylglucosaminidase [Fusarium mangiferae]|uniref:Related to beta-N-acetylglucosaminidase n=1 Tax=Fusarium mangiferae TaxID=192010 RepID=A0A1L7UG87_FUSMA|nr:uncharacterized protein FMAN_14148 [Fusarium mangiferae]CVL08222.1 related to beta-N-acetylglucosaminidase [Fusarium mangiferae]
MSPIESQNPPATLLWDHQNLIPLQKSLGDEDLVLLLTPAVVPSDQSLASASDPFEPLGKALAHTHPWIRHVPYTKELGITSIHVAFIKRVRVVIFVLTGFSTEEGLFQLELAEVAREVCEERPLVLVACCEVSEKGAREYGFPTIIQCPGYSAADLQAVAVLLTTEATPPTGNSLPRLTWSILKWDYDKDLLETHSLWEACLPSKFYLNRSTLGSLLKRDGYAMHYMVREPNQGQAIGFCATFTTFTDSSGDRLIGSVAAIIVHKDFRGQGVGRFLHKEVLLKLKKIRGVGIIQLGSTFPRLLYGLPAPETDTKWFEKQGWNMKEATPGNGNGRRVLDWLLRFADHPAPDLASAGLTFRPCQQTDYEMIVEMANKESQERYGFGWYDQYAKTMDSGYMNDIVVGLERENLIAAAITYFPNNGSPCGADIPWPASIGQSIGGVSCICIKGRPQPKPCYLTLTDC